MLRLVISFLLLLWLAVLSLGCTSFVCCVYKLCVVLQELQKAEVARGTARA